MDSHRNKTQKKLNYESPQLKNGSLNPLEINELDGKKEISDDLMNENGSDPFRTLLEAGAREAFSRQWHRIERGLRLNRLRLFIEDISLQFDMTKDEKEQLFIFLQKALDKKLLNTLKVVIYDQTAQRITTIKGLEIKRTVEGVLTYEFVIKKPRTDSTRKKRKGDEAPSVSTTPDSSK